MSQTKAQLIDPVDGTIVNADINASAAIQGTKISPDFGSQNIATTGTIGSGDITVTSGAPFINFVDSDHDSDFNIQINAGSLNFNDTTNSATRMSITSAGLVGVGTTTPQALLDVNGANNAVVGISLGQALATLTSSRYIGITQNGNANNLATNSGFQGIEFGGPGSAAEGYLAFHTHDNGVNSGERIRIDKSGNVGIGTSSPSSIFHVQQSSGTRFRFDANYFYIEAPDGGNRYFFGETQNDKSAQLSLYNSSDQQKVRIAAGDGSGEGSTFFMGGNVGIGKTNPGSKLEIVTADTGSYVTALNVTNDVNADFHVSLKSSHTSIGPSTGTPFCFHVGGFASEVARFLNDGSFVVGGTALGGSSTFGVQGTGAFRSVLAANAASTTLIGAISGVSNGFQTEIGADNSMSYRFHVGSTEAFRVHTNGNVGVGLSTPSTPLDVSGATTVRIANSNSYVSGLNVTNSVNTDFQIFVKNGAVAVGPSTSSDINFVTSGTSNVQMTINAAGRVGINTSTPANMLEVVNDNTNVHPGSMRMTGNIGGYASLICDNDASSGTRHFISFRIGNQIQADITGNGSVITYGSGSDYRLKENVVAISDGITKVKQLNPLRFNFIRNPGVALEGFFAHEAQEICPQSATGTKDQVAAEDDDGLKKGDPIYQQMDYAKLVPLLTAALKEAITKIETLESDVAALKAA